MKTWLKKFRISNALNDRRPLPPALTRGITQSEELRRFEESSHTLEQALKNQLPSNAANPPLHAAIMRAVRTAGQTPAAENQFAWPRWMPVAATALLVLGGAVLTFEFSRQPSPALPPVELPTLASASSALDSVGSLVRAAPAAAMSPWLDEMQRLDRDLVNTKRLLFASVP